MVEKIYFFSSNFRNNTWENSLNLNITYDVSYAFCNQTYCSTEGFKTPTVMNPQRSLTATRAPPEISFKCKNFLGKFFTFHYLLLHQAPDSPTVWCLISLKKERKTTDYLFM